MEVIALFMAWKLALPGCVAMLRGNHEGEYCAQNYGFQNELLAKYGPKSGKALFASFLKARLHQHGVGRGAYYTTAG